MDDRDPRGTALVPPPSASPGGTTPTTPVALAVGLALLYLVWGSTYLGNRIALESLPPFVSTSTRFLAAAAVLFAVVAVRRGGAGLRLPRAEWTAVAVTGTLMVGTGSALLAVGQQYVPSGLASLLVAAMPVWVLVIRLGTGQRPASLAVAGVLGGLAGLALLLAAPTERWHLVGMLTIVASTVVWALGSALAQRLPMPADHLVGTGWQMLVGGVGVALAGLVVGDWGELRLAAVTGRSWLAWAYLMLVCTVVGFSVYTWLLRRAPLQLVATYAYVNPVLAVLLGMAVLGERLTGQQVLAGGVVLAAVALVVARERPRRWAGLPPGTPTPP
ncbi:EamA family transporter [Micromonospora endophytica]|uniref:EamA family transporter n=1 Tax=Micromonospora endophytica TaxID=515350 RepID=A0A2W2CLS1_9ACTN|nr:EamA family transporter [Micromonospora endophytica]PZF98890.1 EamA family transporter [Micromonospora endophytica]RIW44373.1 EamA family transporter [Micromonospora endophytica]BCJ62428.1 drug/metabolite exporter YedA [Micromonospora endophytica]